MNVNGVDFFVSGVAVASCFGCPWGGAPPTYYSKARCKIENRDATSNPVTNPPDWCPLRRGPITVQLVKNPEADEAEAKSKAWIEEQKNRIAKDENAK